MKKKQLLRVLTVTMAASVISAASVMSVSAQNTVWEAGNNWQGSDYVSATNTGTAITTLQTITVTNVKDQSNGVANSAESIDVVAYQLVKGTYKDGKLTGYVLCDATNAAIVDMENPTVAEITAIANAVRANTTTLNGIHMTKGSGAQSDQYTADVEAGLYIVLATGANGYVYNPAVVAVNIGDANDVAGSADGETVDLAGYWTIPQNAYLKSSTTNFNKDIVSATRRNPGTPVAAKNSEGDIVNKGDIVSFILDGMIVPDYTAEYANGVIYKIDDVLETPSFAGIDTMVVSTYDAMVDDDNDPDTPDVKQNETVVAPTTTTVDDKGTEDTSDDETIVTTNYTIVYKNASGTEVTGDDIAKSATQYTITFSDAWIRANKTKHVEVTYNSNLTEAAYVNGQANKSVATLTYTVDPSNNNGVEVLRDSTYHYTFEIGGKIDGAADGQNAGTVDGKKTFYGYEINKVTDALEQGEEYTADAQTGEYSSENALAGAEFTLYDDEAMTTVHKLYKRNAETQAWEYENAVYTTTSDGHLVFSGLDEGTYYTKETAAPADYTLNENDYKIVIAGTIADGTGAAEEGTLTGYTITTYVKDGSNWQSIGSAVYAFTPAVTKPTTDATALTLDTVVNTATTDITPAEVVDTELASLPATGGVGTIIITVIAAAGMTLFLTLFLVNRRKKKEAKE